MGHAMFGPYRLVGELGGGPLATVHRAHDTGHDDRVVALKIFTPSPDPGFAARLYRDAAVLCALREPHVPPIHRYGEIDGRCYVDMRLVPGPSLDAVLRAGPLPPARAGTLAAQLDAAARALYAAGLGHPFHRADVLVVGEPGRSEFVQVVGIPLGRLPSHDPPVAPAELVRAPRRRRRGLLVGAGVLAVVALVGAGLLVGLRSGGAPGIAADASGLVATLHSSGGVAIDADTGEIDGRPVVAAAVVDGSVHVWDVATGDERRPPVPGAVTALRIATVGGRPVIISRNRDSTLELHDLATGAAVGGPVGTPVPPPVAKPGQLLLQTNGGLAVVDHPGGPVLTCIVDTGRTIDLGYRRSALVGVQAFALPGLTPQGPVVADPGGSLYIARTVPFDDRTAVVSTIGGRVHAYDLDTGAALGVPGAVQPAGMFASTATTLDGVPVAVTGGQDNTVRVWNLRTGTQIGAALTGHTQGVREVWTLPVGGRTVVVATAGGLLPEDGASVTRFWDLATGAPLGAPLTDHPLARMLTVDPDRSLLVGSDRTDTLTVWDAATLTRGTPG